jgi:Flp pilus assembly pilin Flp
MRMFRQFRKSVRGTTIVEYALIGSFMAMSVASMAPAIRDNAASVIARVIEEIGPR